VRYWVGIPMRRKAKRIFKDYLAALAEVVRLGDAREESFYPALKGLLETLARELGYGDLRVTVQPRPTEAGNPDFRVWDGTSRVTGYLEAKPPETNLEKIESTEQLRRYRETFPNLILTNFLEFRLYREGRLVASARLGRPVALVKLSTAPPLEDPEGVLRLFEEFFAYSFARVLSAESLAVELAKRTRFLRDVVREELSRETSSGRGPLLEFYEAFRRYLIGELSPEEFADLYAQTIAYGLFAARTRAGAEFNRRLAFDLIPHTIGVLRDLFRFISLGDLPPEMEWIVDDLAAVLSAADLSGMLSGDPVIHFYETFLACYDPEERERRGVYYTPEPVVSYIVRSANLILKEKFGLSGGLSAPKVTLLDPAAGTMTFVARAVREAVREFTEAYGRGALSAFVREHILRRFYAFELMAAPYAVGHLKMALVLKDLGYELSEEERFPFYLTNTLDMSELEESRLPGLSSLAEESHLAARVKREEPILVILGNPPYSGHSANTNDWTERLLKTDLDGAPSYYKVDGKPLGEKNPKWLQDDYVKFLRFAQWKVHRAGRGLVAMITNHAYLDNPTFRGMRQSLMETFEEIYVFDLHGNSLRRERAPDGGPDENVFDIRQGVAVAFFVKTGRASGPARVFHAELWGRREDKYRFLEENDFRTTPWREVSPRRPFYLFVPREEAEEAYLSFPAVTDIFEKFSVGIVTARDRLTIHFTPEEVWATVLNFARLDPELAREAYQLGKRVSEERIIQAQKDLQESGPSRDYIVPILYRPFDVRYTYYTGQVNGFHERPRPQVMRHMLAGENLALILPKRVEYVGSWQHVFITSHVSEHVAVSLKTIDYHFPLYLYETVKNKDLFGGEDARRRPNVRREILGALSAAYGREVAPEEVFRYVYAVLWAPAYRERFREFLRLDFPRIPFPKGPGVFEALAGLGGRLVEIHLLRSAELDPPRVRFYGEGEARVAKTAREGFRYDGERVWINRDMYFAPVSRRLWEFPVGGYRPAEKWLKDRRGRGLTLDEIRTYCRMLTAFALTLEIQPDLDHLFSNVEENSLAVEGR